LDAGVPIPFIARYRKDRTGGMGEERIREIRETIREIVEIETLREETLRTLTSCDHLPETVRDDAVRRAGRMENSSGLRDIIAWSKREIAPADQVVEERYGALASALLTGESSLPVEELAAPFAAENKGVMGVEVAIGGAVRSLALRFASDLELRQRLKKLAIQKAKIVSKVVKGGDSMKKYETYHDFTQPARTLPSHRVLAILRGAAENALDVTIDVPRDEAIAMVAKQVEPAAEHPFKPLIAAAATVAWDDVLAAEIGQSVTESVKERADGEAVRIFARNLEQLLLLPPAGPVVVMGIEPGVRRGCKIAVVGKDGEFLGHASVFPFPPRNKTDAAKKTIGDFCRQHKVDLIGIGSGPGCREVERFIRAFLKEDEGLTARMAMVNEAGATAYAVSRPGKAEFPKLDPRVRSAVTIARRLRDPLAELVKVEPGAIGVGPYQRDVNQKGLKRALEDVIESCVARIGVDVNSAEFEVLRYLPGIDKAQARKILEWRGKNGAFKSREQLREVESIDEKAWHFASGFCRIPEGETALDRTRIHPECYELAESMAEKLGIEMVEILGNDRALGGLDPEGFTNEEWSSSMVYNVFEELRSPGGDPRGKFEPPQFREDLETITDLKPGMQLEGLVTNIASFGAFVDVGVDQEGLVHVSELSDNFVEDPGAVVSVGAKVNVRVLSVDPERKRLSLSMRTPGAKKPRRGAPGGGRPGERPAGRPGGGRPAGGRPGGRPAGGPGAGRPGGGRPGGGRPGGGRPGGGRPGEGKRPARGGPGRGRPGGGRGGDRRPPRGGGDRPPRVIEQKGKREPEAKIDPNLPEDEVYRLKLERLRKKFEKGK
jgi:uncharacterized protein